MTSPDLMRRSDHRNISHPSLQQNITSHCHDTATLKSGVRFPNAYNGRIASILFFVNTARRSAAPVIVHSTHRLCGSKNRSAHLHLSFSKNKCVRLNSGPVLAPVTNLMQCSPFEREKILNDETATPLDDASANRTRSSMATGSVTKRE